MKQEQNQKRKANLRDNQGTKSIGGDGRKKQEGLKLESKWSGEQGETQGSRGASEQVSLMIIELMRRQREELGKKKTPARTSGNGVPITGNIWAFPMAREVKEGPHETKKSG